MTINISTIIIIFAASFETFNFGLFGGLVADTPHQISFLGGIIGGAISFSAAIVSSRRGSINRHGKNKRENQMEWGLYGLWALPAIIIAPTIYYLLGDKFNPYFQGVMSVTYSLAPSIVMYALGASNGARGVLSLDSKIKIKIPELLVAWYAARVANQKRKVADRLREVADDNEKIATPRNKVAKVADKLPLKKGDLRRHVKKFPQMTQTARAAAFGVSRPTIKKWMDEL